MTSHISRGFVIAAALLSSCKIFDETAVQKIDNPGAVSASMARVKFHNFSPGSVGVDFYIGSAKTSAVSSTSCTPLPTIDSLRTRCLAGGIESTTGTVYGSLGSGGLYYSAAAGSTTLLSKIASRDTVVSTLAQTLTAGKSYSFFMSGIYNTTAKTAEAFVVEDPIPSAIDYTLAHVRLVNAVPNGTGDLTLFVAPTTTTTYSALGTAVAYKAAGTYVTIPEGLYDIAVRYTGSSTNVIARSALTLVGGRVYTVTARGNTATASTMGLDFTSNQR